MCMSCQPVTGDSATVSKHRPPCAFVLVERSTRQHALVDRHSASTPLCAPGAGNYRARQLSRRRARSRRSAGAGYHRARLHVLRGRTRRHRGRLVVDAGDGSARSRFEALHDDGRSRSISFQRAWTPRATTRLRDLHRHTGASASSARSRTELHAGVVDDNGTGSPLVPNAVRVRARQRRQPLAHRQVHHPAPKAWVRGNPIGTVAPSSTTAPWATSRVRRLTFTPATGSRTVQIGPAQATPCSAKEVTVKTSAKLGSVSAKATRHPSLVAEGARSAAGRARRRRAGYLGRHAQARARSQRSLRQLRLHQGRQRHVRRHHHSHRPRDEAWAAIAAIRLSRDVDQLLAPVHPVARTRHHAALARAAGGAARLALHVANHPVTPRHRHAIGNGARPLHARKALRADLALLRTPPANQSAFPDVATLRLRSDSSTCQHAQVDQNRGSTSRRHGERHHP